MTPISFECVPENLYELYHLVGEELFTKIVDVYGSEMLYIPSRSTMERKLKRNAIRKEFDGTNIKELSVKFGYCTKTIKAILKEKV